MSSTTATLPPIDVRLRLSALWATTMIIVAFVDIFAFYRADVREQIEAGSVFVFEIGQPFMLGILIYVAIPSLMIALSVLLPRRMNRVLNIVLAVVLAFTIVGSAIGEWGYFILGSAIELALLAAIVVLAARWRAPAVGSTSPATTVDADAVVQS